MNRQSVQNTLQNQWKTKVGVVINPGKFKSSCLFIYQISDPRPFLPDFPCGPATPQCQWAAVISSSGATLVCRKWNPSPDYLRSPSWSRVFVQQRMRTSVSRWVPLGITWGLLSNNNNTIGTMMMIRQRREGGSFPTEIPIPPFDNVSTVFVVVWSQYCPSQSRTALFIILLPTHWPTENKYFFRRATHYLIGVWTERSLLCWA